jgi:Ca2+-binding RTX toxin-like protein
VGNDLLYGGEDADWLDGAVGNDRLDGGLGDDWLLGGDGNDQLYGGDGADVLEGGAGIDRLEGGGGDDILTGGLGADSFVFHGGADLISDFTDLQDKVYFDRQIWSGMPPTVANLLATASVTDIGLHFDFGAGNTLDIVGIFNANLLADDILFL